MQFNPRLTQPLWASVSPPQKPKELRARELAGEGGRPAYPLLPERPGQAAGEETQQAQGQQQEEEAEGPSEDHVQGGGHEGHLGTQRAVSSGLLYTLGHTNLEHSLERPGSVASDLALFLG